MKREIATDPPGVRLTHGDFLRVALPFIVSTLTQPLLGAVDTAVIGRLGQAELIGGVAIGTLVLNTLYWLFGFFRVNTTSQSAIALGQGGAEAKAASLIHPLLLAGCVGLCFVVAQHPLWLAALAIIQPQPEVAVHAHAYLRVLIWGAPFVLINYTLIGWLMGQAELKATLLTQIVGNVLNIVLDVVLVMGFDMGVAGVALATLVSQITTCVIGIRLVRRSAGFPVLPHLRRAGMRAGEFRSLVAANTDLLLRTVCLLLMFNSMARFGSKLGATTLATNAVMMQLTFLVSYLFDGIANASSVFAGRSLGERSRPMLRLVMLRNLQWTAVLVVMTSVLLAAGGRRLIALFTQIPEVIDGFARLDHWLLLFPLASGFGLTLYGVFTGTSTTRPVRNSTFMAMLLFFVTLALTFDGLKNQGLWLAFTLFYVGRCVFLYPGLGQVYVKYLPRDETR
jgi:MATE family multidrug resistance protein